MTTTPLLPDTELVLVDYLRQHPGLATENVYTELPARRDNETQDQWESRVFPALRVNGFPGGTTRAKGGLFLPRCQVDTWDTSKWLASRAARKTFAALRELDETGPWRHEDSDGTVSWLIGIRDVNPPGWLPDERTKRVRYMFDVTVILRAVSHAFD